LTLPASISERASGIEQGTISTPPETRILQPGRRAVRRHPRHGARIEPLVLEQAREREVPDAALPGAEALNLPGFAFTAASRSFTDL
jgi:hypothetical protein